MAADPLARFIEAQAEGVFESAYAEIEAGRKQSHWMWFVFPQIAGLGLSYMSQTYAIRDRAEAVAYLQHPVLAARLLAITIAASKQLRAGVPVDRLMGSSIDAAKLVSSMTLFGQVAPSLATSEDDGNAKLGRLAEEIVAIAEKQGYARCRHTIDRLN